MLDLLSNRYQRFVNYLSQILWRQTPGFFKKSFPLCKFRQQFDISVRGYSHLAGKAGLEPATYGLENRSSIR